MKGKQVIGSIVFAGIIVIVGANQIGNKDKGGEVKAAIEDVQAVEQEKEPEVNDVEEVNWITATNEMLSEPLDDPSLKETNNDKGYEIYLKSIKVKEAFHENFEELPKENEIHIQQIMGQAAMITHLQFVRTAHLGHEGQAIEDTTRFDQWEPTHDDTFEAFEEMKKVVEDMAENYNE